MERPRSQDFGLFCCPVLRGSPRREEKFIPKAESSGTPFGFTNGKAKIAGFWPFLLPSFEGQSPKGGEVYPESGVFGDSLRVHSWKGQDRRILAFFAVIFSIA
jgi:hypothetical protein